MAAVQSIPKGAVRQALVLAAGNGDRFKNRTRESKLLEPVLGRPLILRTIETARWIWSRRFRLPGKARP